MVSPRITKCGHIYCWPCILQYLAYDRDTRTAPSFGQTWKRCPLCNEHVHKHELKSVRVVQNQEYNPGSEITFNLMVRSKGNIIVKDKSLSLDDELLAQKFPLQTES